MKKNEAGKEKLKEEFKKKIEQSKKELEKKKEQAVPARYSGVSFNASDKQSLLRVMANPQAMITAKQSQLAAMNLNTNNNQKFSTVINVSATASDPKMIAQEVKQALSNKMLAHAYGVSSPEANQQETSRRA